MNKTKSSVHPSISVLAHDLIPRTHKLHGSRSKLVPLSPTIIACIYSHEEGLASITFNLQSRKVLQKISINGKYEPIVDSDSLIKDGDQNFIVVRCSNTEFQILSVPRLKLRCVFKTQESEKSNLNFCYMNGEVITWFDDRSELTFWKLFATTSSSVLKLPFAVGPYYSQLTNRDLLILQNSETNKLVFVNVKQKKVADTAKSEHHLNYSVNSEDRIFRSRTTFMQGAVSGEMLCDKLTSRLTLSSIGKLRLNGAGIQTHFLDGAKIILWQNFWDLKLYEMTDKELITYKMKRPKNERYIGFLQLSQSRRMFCLVGENKSLMLLQFR